MPKERDLYWKPKMPQEIAPEIFKKSKDNIKDGAL